MQTNTDDDDSDTYMLRPRGPGVWVFSVLAIVWILSVVLGFGTWYQLGLPGKDPMPELEMCGMAGFVLAAAVYAVGFRHTWHLSPRAILLAVTLGLFTGLSAVTWHVLGFEY